MCRPLWPQARPSAGMRQALAGLLVLALLLAQSLGLWHGVVHAPQSHLPGYPATSMPAGASGQPATEATGLARLFAAHHDDADCRAYDQLSHGDLLASLPVVLLPLVLQPFVLSVLSGLATARWHALFEARGPPPVR